MNSAALDVEETSEDSPDALKQSILNLSAKVVEVMKGLKKDLRLEGNPNANGMPLPSNGGPLREFDQRIVNAWNEEVGSLESMFNVLIEHVAGEEIEDLSGTEDEIERFDAESQAYGELLNKTIDHIPNKDELKVHLHKAEIKQDGEFKDILIRTHAVLESWYEVASHSFYANGEITTTYVESRLR